MQSVFIKLYFILKAALSVLKSKSLFSQLITHVSLCVNMLSAFCQKSRPACVAGGFATHLGFSVFKKINSYISHNNKIFLGWHFCFCIFPQALIGTQQCTVEPVYNGPVLSGHPLLSGQFLKSRFSAHTNAIFVTCIRRPPLLSDCGHPVAVLCLSFFVIFICIKRSSLNGN